MTKKWKFLGSKDRKLVILSRLARLKSLRAAKAPGWVIKSEQVALALNRSGLRHTGIGKDMSAYQSTLYVRHVLPLMGQEDEE